MTNLTRYLRATLELTALICVGIICISIIYVLYILVLSKANIATAMNTIGLPQVGRSFFYDSQGSDGIEREYVESDHKAVYGWVIGCMNIKNIKDLPDTLAHELMRPFAVMLRKNDEDEVIDLPEGTRIPTHPEESNNSF